MINHKKLIAMARKWKKLASMGRKRISIPRTENRRGLPWHSSELVSDKGHFVVYTADKRRFVIPLVYLTTNIFRELFRISEEEFGLPGDGPITLPCDAAFMEYVVSSVRQRCVSKELENALLASMATGRCSFSSSLLQGQINQHRLIPGL